MKKLILISLVIVLTVCLLFAACAKPAPTPAPTPPAKEILIRMTTPIPPTDEFAIWLEEGMAKFNERARGAYKMQLFAGGQLVSVPESLDAIRTGVVEGGVIPLGAYAGAVPEFGLVELPFLFNNNEANAYAMPGIKEVWDELLQAKCNQRTLGCMAIGTFGFLCAKKQVKTVEDVKGLVFGCDTPPMVDLVKALGGSGIIVDFTEDYSNLQKGVIDAKTSAPQYIFVAKLYEVAKYYTVFHGLAGLYSININSDVYNKMPRDIKDAINEEMSALAASVSQKYVNKFYELQPELTKLGLQYYFLPPAERDRWKALAYPVTLSRLAEFGDVGAKIREITDKANTKYPYKLE